MIACNLQLADATWVVKGDYKYGFSRVCDFEYGALPVCGAVQTNHRLRFSLPTTGATVIPAPFPHAITDSQCQPILIFMHIYGDVVD